MYYNSPVTIHNIMIRMDKSIKLGESDLMMLKEYASVNSNDALVHYSDDLHTKLNPSSTDNDDVDKSMYIHTLLHSSPSTNQHPLINDKSVVRLITPPPHTSTAPPSTVSSSTSTSSDSTAAPTLSSNVYTINAQEAYSFTYLISRVANTTTTAGSGVTKERGVHVVAYSTPITVFYTPQPPLYNTKENSINNSDNSSDSNTIYNTNVHDFNNNNYNKIVSMTVYALWSE